MPQTLSDHKHGMRRSGSAVDTQPTQTVDAATHAEEDMLSGQLFERRGSREIGRDLREPEFFAGLLGEFVFANLLLTKALVE